MSSTETENDPDTLQVLDNADKKWVSLWRACL